MDLVLANCVKLQALVENINKTVAESSDPLANKAPIWMHMSSMKIALQNIASSLPLSVRQESMSVLRLKPFGLD